MPIPKNKGELQNAIEETYSKLKKDLERVPLDFADLLEMEGHAKGTMMSPSNLVAYLIGWGELVLKWNKKISKGEKVIFPEEDFKWTELGDLAQKFYKDYEELAYPKLLKKLDQVIKKIMIVIEGKNNEEIYGVVWYKNYSMGRMIQLNTSSPYKNARSRIRKWLKTKV